MIQRISPAFVRDHVLSLLVLCLCVFLSFTSYAQSSPPYLVTWVKGTGVSYGNGFITRTESSGSVYLAAATSANLLPANTDGWIEFTTSAAIDYMVGFATNDAINPTAFTNGIQITSGGYVAYDKNVATTLTGWAAGNVIRISREGDKVHYYRNGIDIRSVDVDPALPLKIKALVYVVNRSTPVVYTSLQSQLVVVPVTTPADGNGTGGIILSVAGGTAPYTYLWSSNDQTSAITNKPVGSYSVIVTDAVGSTRAATYEIGQKITWTNIANVNMNGNGSIITKNTGVVAYHSGGTTTNLLMPDTDGFLEFTVGPNEDYIIGFASNDAVGEDRFLYGLQIDSQTGRIHLFEGSAVLSNVGQWAVGDIIRISREGSFVRYRQNNSILREIATNTALQLNIKGVMRINAKSTPVVNSSFNSRLLFLPTIVGLAGNTGGGNVSTQVIGGTAPYSSNWSTGESGTVLTNKPPGTYTLNIQDSKGRSDARTYRIGYRPSWTGHANVSINGTLIAKNTGVVTWHAGAYTTNVLPPNTDGWIEFPVHPYSDFILGFSNSTAINTTTFTNAFLITLDANYFWTVEGANPSVSQGHWTVGDVFRIEREGSNMKYYRNEQLIRTIAVNANQQLFAKVALRYSNRTSPYINTSFWKNDAVVKTYYSIANGQWTNPATWSLTAGGPPATTFPSEIDNVIVRGHTVTVNGTTRIGGVQINALTDDTKLLITGPTASLSSKGNIVITNEGRPSHDVLIVENNGKLDVK